MYPFCTWRTSWIAVNNQTGIDLTTATHMGAVGTQIPATMGADANTQQVPPVANMLTAQTEADSLAANQFIEQATATLESSQAE
jgi:hypothetical protein